MSKKPVIYLAGALHSASQREFLELVATLLDDCYDVFVPHRDGGLYQDMVREARGSDLDAVAQVVAGRDIAAIESSVAVLVVSTSRFILDPGACVEIGYAYARGIPVLAYAPDLDTSPAFNPMVRACLRSVFRNVTSMREHLTGPTRHVFTKENQQ